MNTILSNDHAGNPLWNWASEFALKNQKFASSIIKVRHLKQL